MQLCEFCDSYSSVRNMASLTCPVCHQCIRVKSKKSGLGDHFRERHPENVKYMEERGGMSSVVQPAIQIVAPDYSFPCGKTLERLDIIRQVLKHQAECDVCYLEATRIAFEEASLSVIPPTPRNDGSPRASA